MYGQKQIIYPDGKTKQGIRTDIFDIAAHFTVFFITYFLIKLVFEETGLPYGFGICFTYLAFLGFTVFYICSRQKSFSKKAILPLSLCVVTALSVAVHGYTFYWTIPFLFYFSGLFCIGVTDTKGAGMNSWLDPYYQFKAMLLIPVIKLFTPFISVIKNIRIKRSKKYIGLIVGFICGVPVFLVVTSLLIESDAAFNTVMDKFIKWLDDLLLSDSDFLDPLFVIPTLMFAPYIMSTVFGFRHGIIKEKVNFSNTEHKARELRFIPSSALCGFFGVVALCYVIYLLSQLSYLFGAFSGEIPVGTSMRLSDYARRGFFEMSAVAFINLLLISFGAILSKRDRNGKVSPYYKGFSAFFCVFTMLLIITAMSKMALYITDMGLTQKRIAVSLADIVFFVAFLCIFVKLFKKNFPYMKVIMCTFLVMVTAFFVVSPQKIIASYNVNAYLSGAHKTLDAEYISYGNSDYYAMINLDRVATSDKKSANDAKAEVCRIYNWHKNCINESANSVNEYRLHKFIKENEERIRSYKKIFDIKTYDLDNYPYISEDKLMVNVFLFEIETEKQIEEIQFNNVINGTDDDSFDYYGNGLIEEYDIISGETDLYLEYPSDADIIADVVIKLKNGEKYNCTMPKPKDDDSHYYVITDDGKGGFAVRESGKD